MVFASLLDGIWYSASIVVFCFFFCSPLLDTCCHIQNIQVVSIKEEAILYIMHVHTFIYTQNVCVKSWWAVYLVIRNTDVVVTTLHPS